MNALPDDVVLNARAAFEAAKTPADLENVKAQFLGKTGQITELMKGLSQLSVDDKKTQGAKINALKTAIEQALQAREFMPEILRLDGVNSFSTPSVWSVQTSRGNTEFVLKGEEDIRRLSVNTLVVSDAHGVQYLIRHLPALDRHTRKLLDRFL